ncbi:MAG: hypothetical protein AAGF12_01130 [Myxococcota bacterium]
MDAIDAMYRTFARYRRSDAPSGCPCCVSAQDQGQLRGTLRTLTSEQLGRFAFKAMTTWGDVDDYKYYLPRIFELARDEPSACPIGLSPWLMGSKLRYGNWKEWPSSEQAAVYDGFGALFAASIGRAELGATTEVFRGLRNAGIELGAFLHHWDPLSSPAHAATLAEAVQETELHRDPTVGSWLLSTARRIELERAFERFVDTSEADAIARGVDYLTCMLF